MLMMPAPGTIRASYGRASCCFHGEMRLTRALAAGATLLLIGGCFFLPPGIDGDIADRIKKGRAGSEAGIANEVTRCTKYYPGKFAEGEFVRANNAQMMREKRKEGVVHVYTWYTVNVMVAGRLLDVDQTTFELPVDQNGRILECRVSTQHFEAPKDPQDKKGK